MRKERVSNPFANTLIAASLLAVSQCSWGIGISFNQLDWLDGSGGYTAQNSEWGVANLQLSSADASLFTYVPGVGYQGYISVSTQLQITGSSVNWAVQNLPIAFAAPADLDGRLPESATFNLGITRGSLNLESMGSSALRFGLSVSDTPTTAMPILSGPAVAVLTAQALFGGEEDPSSSTSGYSGEAAPAAAVNSVGALPGEKQGLVGKIFGKESDIPAVDEEKNGCAPGGVARSLKYMAAQNGLTLPETVQQVYDTLKDKDHMKTSLGATGTGTQTALIKTGKDKYVGEKKLDIKTKQTTDVEEAKKALNKKGDVEIGIRFKGKDKDGNDVFWGHRAFVSEIIDLTDALGNPTGFTVKYLDDGVQGDGKASNTPHSITFNADGTGRSAGVVGLINFQVEIVPEPGTLALLACGMLPLVVARRRRMASGRH